MRKILFSSLMIGCIILFGLDIHAQQNAKKTSDNPADTTKQSRLNSFNELIKKTSDSLKVCVENLNNKVVATKTIIEEGTCRDPKDISEKFVEVMKSSAPCLKMVDNDSELFKEAIVLIKLSERAMEDAKITERKEPAMLLKSIVEVNDTIIMIRLDFDSVLNNIILAKSKILNDTLLKDIETSAATIEPALEAIKKLNGTIDKLNSISIKIR